MAEAGPEKEKSRGLKFAERQLLRHGWEHGKGLGRDENGISEAIKVKVKCGKGGVGHKEGDQFTFHWWDHVFNQASSSLQVESHRDGIQVRKTSDDNENAGGIISNKKPLKASLVKARLYGSFVKSATLLSGQEQCVDNTSSDSSSSDEDKKELDLSSTTKLSDAELVKACGGRTAHKGARHGLKMSAKLARLEQQEAEFMAKYGKKTESESDSKLDRGHDTPKKKKKKSKDLQEISPSIDTVENVQAGILRKHTKKKEKDGGEEEIHVKTEVKVKRKKRRREPESDNLENGSTVVTQNRDNDAAFLEARDSSAPKKKKSMTE